jgi:sulfite exporter TauE/SafE
LDQYLIAFMTGLTTGGLSCLAVQGGLLAASLSQQLEIDLSDATGRLKKSQTSSPVRQGRQVAAISLFLLSKLTAYTLLGLLLGAVGSVFQLNATARAVLMILIGIFMVGNALRMLNVHPFFRIFVLEPPRGITRFIRRTARQGSSYFSPLFLGGLTVLIPCGVTQAMMAVALGSGDPITGAALMFAFTLGTSPVFFLLAYLTLQLGRRLEKWFLRIVAVLVLVFGLISINSGLNLAGSRLSISRAFQSTRQVQLEQSQLSENGVVDEISLDALNNGYSPRRISAPADRELVLNVNTNNTFSCSRAFLIPALRVQVILPETGSTRIAIPAQPAGTTLPFTCSMGMYTGEIVFDLQ